MTIPAVVSPPVDSSTKKDAGFGAAHADDRQDREPRERPLAGAGRQAALRGDVGSADPLDSAFNFGAALERDVARAEVRQLLGSPEMRRIFTEDGRSRPTPAPRAPAAHAETDRLAEARGRAVAFSPIVFLAAATTCLGAALIPAEIGPVLPDQGRPAAPLQASWAPGTSPAFLRDGPGRAALGGPEATADGLAIVPAMIEHRPQSPLPAGLPADRTPSPPGPAPSVAAGPSAPPLMPRSPFSSGGAALPAPADAEGTADGLARAPLIGVERGPGPVSLAGRMPQAPPSALAFAPRDAGPSRAEAEAALVADRQQRLEIQQRLRLAGFAPQGIDGIFGARTRAAIADWQRHHGLAATGFLDRDQLALLSRETDPAYAIFLEASRRAAAIRRAEPSRPAEGSRGDVPASAAAEYTPRGDAPGRPGAPAVASGAPVEFTVTGDAVAHSVFLGQLGFGAARSAPAAAAGNSGSVAALAGERAASPRSNALGALGAGGAFGGGPGGGGAAAGGGGPAGGSATGGSAGGPAGGGTSAGADPGDGSAGGGGSGGSAGGAGGDSGTGGSGGAGSSGGGDGSDGGSGDSGGAGNGAGGSDSGSDGGGSDGGGSGDGGSDGGSSGDGGSDGGSSGGGSSDGGSSDGGGSGGGGSGGGGSGGGGSGGGGSGGDGGDGGDGAGGG